MEDGNAATCQWVENDWVDDGDDDDDEEKYIII